MTFRSVLGPESLFANQGRIARAVGRHAGVPSDHVENGRALHHSAYHAGLVRSRPSCVPVLCLKVFLATLDVSRGSPSQT